MNMVKNLANNLGSPWEGLVVMSIKDTLDGKNNVDEIFLDLDSIEQADRICKMYLEKYDVPICYDFRNDLFYFKYKI